MVINPVISAFIGGIIAFLAANFTKWLGLMIERFVRIKKEQRLLIAELTDIKRHFFANLEILNNIDLNCGIPSSIHFIKMRVNETSLILSPETFRNIHSDYSMLIYRLRTIIVNSNIELDGIVNYIKKDQVDISVLQRYISYIKDKMAYVTSRLTYELDNLKKDEKPAYTGNKRPKKIIYEKQIEVLGENILSERKFEDYLDLNHDLFRDINDNI